MLRLKRNLEKVPFFMGLPFMMPGKPLVIIPFRTRPARLRFVCEYESSQKPRVVITLAKFIIALVISVLL